MRQFMLISPQTINSILGLYTNFKIISTLRKKVSEITCGCSTDRKYTYVE